MPRPDGRDRERGSASIATAASVALALVVSLLVLDLWRAVLARGRAQTAADAAALAAAGAMASGDGTEAASEARRFAELGGAVLESCACEPGAMEAIVVVRLTFAVMTLPGGSRSVRATARAVVDLPAGDASGLRPWFAARVVCLRALVPGITIVSGFRTRAQQAALYREKPDLAAPPGRSLHELGLAVDLAFPAPAAAARAHALAPACGLGFEVPGEPWHAAPLGME